MIMFGFVGANLVGMYTACSVIGFALLGVVSGLYSTSARMYPADIRNSGVALAIGFGRAGAIIGPAVAGILRDADVTVTTLFYLFAVPLLISAVSMFVIKFDDPITVGAKAKKQAA